MSRPNRAERIINFLEARYPGWVPAIELEPVGGRQAWRTAVSEARAIVKGHGDDIENRTRTRYIHALECPSWYLEMLLKPCRDCQSQTWTLSEYRLKKRGESSQTPKDEKSLAPAHALPHRDGQDLRAHTEKAPHDLNDFSLR